MIPAFVNSLAGNADASCDVLRAIGGGAFDVRQSPPSALVAHVRMAIEQGARRIAVAGGDGSIGTVAGVIAGTGIELAILPCGTLNHLAKDLSIPLDLEQAARLAIDGQSVPIDAATVNGRIFVNTSSVGAYVRFVRDRERLEGRLGYHVASLVAGTRLLIRMPTVQVTLKVGGVEKQYVTPLVFVGVGERELKLPTLGARVRNGIRGLHVMVVRERSGGRTLALGLAAAARGVDAVAHTPALDAFLVDSFRIGPRVKVAAVDGELLPVAPPLEYRYLADHLRIVVPAPIAG